MHRNLTDHSRIQMKYWLAMAKLSRPISHPSKRFINHALVLIFVDWKMLIQG